MNKYFFLFLTSICLLTSCGKNEMTACGKNETANADIQEAGWYTPATVTTSNFDRINQAIDNHEVLTSGVYASPNLFFSSNGSWDSSDSRLGACRNLPDGYMINACYINNGTVVFHIGWLWDPESISASDKVIGKVYAGKNFGELVYRSAMITSTQTYTKKDNKIYLSNGSVYTLTSSGMTKDGSGKEWRKYDPSKSF